MVVSTIHVGSSFLTDSADVKRENLGERAFGCQPQREAANVIHPCNNSATPTLQRNKLYLHTNTMTAPPSLTSPPNIRRSRESDLIHENDTSFSTIAFLPTSFCLLFPRMPKTIAGDHSGVSFYVRTYDIHGLLVQPSQHLDTRHHYQGTRRACYGSTSCCILHARLCSNKQG